MTTKYFPFGGQTYTLGSSIGSTNTTILLSSFLEPITGTPYTMALLNTDIAYGTIGPKTSSSEFISFAGITQNIDGSATLTGVTRGLAKKYPFTTDVSYKQPHAGQSIFIISDAPQVFNQYSVIGNDETISGVKTYVSTAIPKYNIHPTFTVDEQIIDKKYADDLSYVGSPDMSLTVKGIGEEATAAEINAGTQTGGTAAELIVNPKYLKDSDYYTLRPTTNEKAALAGTGTPSVSNKYVTADTDALKELLTNKSTTTTLGTSDTLYPTQNAVKTYVDTQDAANLLILTEVVASNNLKASADTERNGNDQSFTKCKEIQVKWWGTIRVKYDIKNDTGTASPTVHGRVYRNGVAVGTDNSTTSLTYTTFTDDITVSYNDLVQLYTYTTNNSQGNWWAKNFRLYWDTTSPVARYIVNTD